jgi:hypothetical protein
MQKCIQIEYIYFQNVSFTTLNPLLFLQMEIYCWQG